MPVNNHDDEMNPAVADSLNNATEEALSGLIGVASSSFKNAQSGLKLLKEKLVQHKEVKSQELKIQIGRKIVFRAKPGQKSETVMSSEQGKTLNEILQDPSKAEGSLKVSFGKEKVLHISQGKILADKLGLLRESQTQKQAEAQKQSEVQKPTESTNKAENQKQPESIVQTETPQQTQGIPGLDNNFVPDAPVSEFPTAGAEAQQQSEAPQEAETQQPETQTQFESQQQAESIAEEQLQEEPPVEARIQETAQEFAPEDSTENTESIEQNYSYHGLTANEYGEPEPWALSMVDDPRAEWSDNEQYMANAGDDLYGSPVGEVLEKIDNAPGLVDPPTDPIAKQNQINQYNQPPQQQAPELSKDEVIEQLRSLLQHQSESVEKLSEQINQLNERMNKLSPVKLANEQLGSWVNKQRNSLANMIRNGADRLAHGIEKHNESTAKLTQDVKDTVDKFKAGMERHDEVVEQVLDKFADIRDTATEKVSNVSETVQEITQQAKQTQQQVTDSPQYQKGVAFFKSVAEPAVRGVVNQLDRIDGVEKDDQGNRTLKSENYNWIVTHDNKVQITNKDGEQITPATLDQKSLDTIKTFASHAQQKGYIQTEAVTQSQAHSPEQPKQTEAQKPVVKV